MTQPLHAIIAGAGIAGLTAALLLARDGHRVTILEQSEILEEAGAGLQLSPNATSIFTQAGLLERILRYALAPEALRVRRARDGVEIMNLQYGPLAELRWGAPHLVIHRADLQRVLLESAAANPAITVKTGVSVLGFAAASNGIQVGAQLRSKSPGSVNLRFDGDILIGADGLNSAVRKRLGLGEGDQLIYSNRTAWRALLPAAAAPPEALILETNLWLGPHAHLVHYPLRGGELVNLVAIMEDSWQGGPVEQFWQQNGAAGEIRSRFAGWHPNARALIDAVDEWKRWPLFDRIPVNRWSVDRVVLAGDAAHPVLPYFAQGAGLAIEDAAALAKAISEHPADINGAIATYEKSRMTRTAELRLASRRQGAIYHLSGPFAMARDFVMSRLDRERLMAKLDWIYKYRVS